MTDLQHKFTYHSHKQIQYWIKGYKSQTVLQNKTLQGNKASDKNVSSYIVHIPFILLIGGN